MARGQAAIGAAGGGWRYLLPGATAADDGALRKARGAFFTPPALCRYMVDWAVRSGSDAVLEPGCGEAAFLLAAAGRLTGLGGSGGRLRGIEVHPASARAARRALAGTGHDAAVRVADFFTVPPRPAFDVVVGNPPFVRYQDLGGEAGSLGRAAALRAGVRLTRLASSWAAFTVHSALFLKPAGRLALVLPAELLSVNYAAEVRGFLTRRFGRVRLVLFTELVFPGVLEDVLLLLAEGEGGTGVCELHQARDLLELRAGSAAVSAWSPGPGDARWTPALLPGAVLAAYTAATAGAGMGTLAGWGETTLGAVTGNNGYFALTPERARAAGLEQARDLVQISPPGSRHLRGLALTRPGWAELGRHGRSVWLFRPAGDPSPAGRAYVAAGEAAGVPSAYKCRVRRPWWRVPLGPPADLLLTCMNADTPRLTANAARVHHLNSVHGVYLAAGLRDPGTRLLPLAALNSLTLLGAETVGRAYGGGMLKLEPGEADRLPVPAAELVTGLAGPLAGLRAAAARALAAGRLLDAVALVDRVVLREGLGLTGAEVARLAAARAMLAGRRAARAAGGRRSREPLD